MQGSKEDRRRPEETTAPLWRALANPTRRQILDLLRDRPQVTGEIAAHFATSRIAVMRHLDKLADAGLVINRKQGRQRWHYLNAVPLQPLHRRRASPSVAGFASALLRLQDPIQAEGRNIEPIWPTMDVALDIEIAATRAAVFAALTRDIGGWWGHPLVTARAGRLSLDPRLGGQFVKRCETGGEVIATVTGWAQDEHLRLSGAFHVGVAIGEATFDLAESGAGTLVQFSFRAIGVINTAVAEATSRGWTELIGTRLKELAEAGTRLRVGPGRAARCPPSQEGYPS